jgi:hypothetical protein
VSTHSIGESDCRSARHFYVTRPPIALSSQLVVLLACCIALGWRRDRGEWILHCSGRDERNVLQCRGATVEVSLIFARKEIASLALFAAHTRSNMKFAVHIAITISLIAAVAAVTTTAYTDSACKNQATSTSDLPNPFVQNLNACAKFSTLGYSKVTSCGGGKVKGAFYLDAGCATTPTVFEYDTDKCVSEAGESIFVTCSPASYVTMTFLAVSTAALALCL